MKKSTNYLLISFLVFFFTSSYANIDLQGAWSSTLRTRSHDKVNVFAMIQDDFVVITYYSAKDGSFIRTFGGEVHPTDHDMSLLLEFDSEGAKQTGKVMHFHYKASKNKIHFDRNWIWIFRHSNNMLIFHHKHSFSTWFLQPISLRVLRFGR